MTQKASGAVRFADLDWLIGWAGWFELYPLDGLADLNGCRWIGDRRPGLSWSTSRSVASAGLISPAIPAQPAILQQAEQADSA